MNAYLINWIKNYLTHITQSVVLSGVLSLPLPVLFRVLQGSVLGHLLFLLYNDICDAEISNRSYADDILLYQAVHSPDDYTLLQHDVNALAARSSTKLLKFNPTNCNVNVVVNSYLTLFT